MQDQIDDTDWRDLVQVRAKFLDGFRSRFGQDIDVSPGSPLYQLADYHAQKMIAEGDAIWDYLVNLIPRTPPESEIHGALDEMLGEVQG